MNIYSKSLFTAGLTLAAAIASASPFSAVSIGTFETFATYYTTSEDVLASTTAPFASLDTLEFLAVYGGVGVDAGSFATFSNTAATDTLTLSFTGGPFYLSSQVSSSIAGDWSFVSGTGSYASVTSGAGTWSASYLAAGTFSQTTFVGELEAVPEPATMSIMAIGVVGLLVRRRRQK